MPWQDINLKFFARSSNFNRMLGAVECAKGWLEMMKRKDERDEFVHAERTAQIYLYHLLRNEKPGSVLIKNLESDLISCLFHDIPENINPKIFEYIRVYYGKYINNKVDLLTIGKGISPEIYFSRVFSDLVTGLIKIADRLHNLRNMTFNLGRSEFFSSERLSDQVAETKKFMLPKIKELLKANPKHRNLINEMLKELLYSIRDAEVALGNHV